MHVRVCKYDHTLSQSPGNEASDMGSSVTTPPPIVLGMRPEKWGPEWTADHSQEVLMAGAANVHGYLDY